MPAFLVWMLGDPVPPGSPPLTPLGLAFRESAPTVVRNDPDYLSIWHATARECERLADRIEHVRAQFFPRTADDLLKAWELMVKTTVEPEGLTLEERRQIVLARLLRMASDPSGLAWQENVTALVGPGWDYLEHIPGDPSSPDTDTIRVYLPYPPGSDRYGLTEALLRDITPAHVDIVLVSLGGFILDESQMDQEGMGV